MEKQSSIKFIKLIILEVVQPLDLVGIAIILYA